MLIVRLGQEKENKPKNYSFVVVVDEEMNNQLLSYAEKNNTDKNEIVGKALQRFFASEVEVEELKEKEVENHENGNQN